MWLKRFLLGLTVLCGLIIGGLAALWVVLWLSLRTSTVGVPNVEGLSPESAAAALQRTGLVPRLQAAVPDSKHPKGVVAKQRPVAGFHLKRGSPVFLYPSSGALSVVVPDFGGLPPAAAVAQLEELGLQEGSIAEVYGEGEGSVVVAQFPPPGGAAPVGGAVSLLINRNGDPLRVVMPDLVGEALPLAREVLVGSGFRLDGIEYVPYSGLVSGTVLKQTPAPGGPAVLGGGVLLWVAR